MKYFAILVSATLIGFSANLVSAQEGKEIVNYKTAYNNAQAGDKPLLVLVTAEWCPPCQALKRTTLPELNKKEAFQNFHFSVVDLDADEKVGRQLIGDRGVPQFIMFEKVGDQWIKRHVAGYQTVAQVEAFMAQAKKIRLAENTQELSSK